MKSAKPDSILRDAWKAKDTLAKRFNYDIHQLAEYLRQQESKNISPQTRGKRAAARPKHRVGAHR